jgi:hypothetical protein
MNKKFLLIILTCVAFSSYGRNYFGYEYSSRLYLSSGINYNFIITSDQNFFYDSYHFSIPLLMTLDFRFIEWFSLAPAFELDYSLETMRLRDTLPVSDLVYNHSLIIKLPLNIRFYPLVYKNDLYQNFYLSVGFFPWFWTVNAFYYERDRVKYSGNAYQTEDPIFPDPGVYTPVNGGIKLAIGNSFPVHDKVLVGLELFGEYLFAPYVNGYSGNLNYAPYGPVVLKFNASFGALLSIGFELTRE